MGEKVKHEEYNEEPVEYCTRCLSLAIMDLDGIPYCDKCGCSDIAKIDIKEWEKLYGARYGGEYSRNLK